MPSNKSGKKKFQPLPPVHLTAQQTRLFQKHDFIGLEYAQCERIRGLRKRTLRQEETLTKHDQEEDFIRDNPDAALRDAHESMNRGSTLLLKLIRAKSLRDDAPQAGEDFDCSYDRAFDCLTSRIDYLNRQLVRLAEERIPQACVSFP